MVGLLCSLSACASMTGFPADPAGRSDLGGYYGPQSEAKYDNAGADVVARTTARNEIVRKRMHGYDLEYSDFKRALARDANGIGVGGSLAVLTLSGLAATSGHVGTANALAAASAGIVGGQGVVNKELYYQKTLPALMALMDAARDRVILAILSGLSSNDDSYSLAQANVDLARLKDAGSIEAAIGSITETATAAKSDAAGALERTAAFTMTLVPRQTAIARVRGLSDAQVVALANAMRPDFDTASPGAQSRARRFLPAAGEGFTTAKPNNARNFVSFWISGETMSPDRQAVWDAAISGASRL